MPFGNVAEKEKSSVDTILIIQLQYLKLHELSWDEMVVVGGWINDVGLEIDTKMVEWSITLYDEAYFKHGGGCGYW